MAIGSRYRFQFSGFPVTVGAVSNRTIGVNLAVSNYGRYGFLTAPFCINISNNAKDENICVRSRAIHCASFFEYKRRNELRDYERVLSLN